MDNLLTEEREEMMVTSEKGFCLKKSHFLKPISTSIDGFVGELPCRDQRHSNSSSSLQLKHLSMRNTFSGFWLAQREFISWLGNMEALYENIWEKAGIFEAIKASTYQINKNPSLILSVAEKWCSETKSFVFSWGEATITLEDVMVLLGFSVLGSPAFAPLESSEMIESANKLEKVRLESIGKSKQVTQRTWISRFLGRGDQTEHEAFLVLWLSYFVFPGTARPSISRHVIPIAVRLAAGERIALAPAVLAILYKDLGRICDFARGRSTDKVNFKSLFKLVQVWTWERFRNIRPKATEIPKDKPRIARWDNLQHIFSNVSLSFDDFDWRPYTKVLKNWNPLRFYNEEAKWVTVDDNVDHQIASFARCITASQLAGNGFVEDYFPHRVAMQFGLAQDLPGLVTHHSDYNKPVNGLKLYMPSLLSREYVTTRYRDWWLKSVSDFLGSEELQKESTEAFIARNALDHYDHDNNIALSSSSVVKKMEEGFSSKRRRLVKRYKISESVHMKQACEDDEEYDNMTISQIVRSRKKCSDVEKNGVDAAESLGKRTRKYLAMDSDDDSGSCQKRSLIQAEERTKEYDDTAKDPAITRQTCDDVDGSNAEKKAVIDDATKDAESWLQEDREKKIWTKTFCSEVTKEEDVGEKLKQRMLALKQRALELDARFFKMEQDLTNIREWKTRPQNGVSA